MITDLNRRNFLAHAGSAVSAVWISAHWPAIVAAAEHAHQAAKSASPAKFQFFSPEQAVEIDAISARIIPSDETPGAREAGVVYFIDRALMTFAADDQKTYREGLPEIQKRVHELFPEIALFSTATSDQQETVLESLDQAGTHTAPRRPRATFRGGTAAQPLFEVLRLHTIAGFLIDPDGDRKGNRGGVGWTVIGREPGHSFQPPFSAIDKDYPGWQPASSAKDADKK